ncbi:putative ferric-chelate reductase 1 [Pelobates fuscus]|uniref:putative ferric-chelate reductase 1 n=1 Tax=Pelobates fuscus TaxID=191477 RepID=UPI002FE497E2
MNLCTQNLIFLLALLYPLCITAYPNGQGIEGSCTTLQPSHGASAQTSSAPYTVGLSKSTYSSGERITVTLNTNPGATQFTGFLIQARAGSSNIPIGSFEINNSNAQMLTCTTTASAVSHTSNSKKSNIQVTWVAPNANITNLQFRATVVQVEKIFWINVASSTLTYVAATTSSTTVSTPTTATQSNSSRNIGITAIATQSNSSRNIGITAIATQSNSSRNIGITAIATQSNSLGNTSITSIANQSISSGSTSTTTIANQSTSSGSTSTTTVAKQSNSSGSTSTTTVAKQSTNSGSILLVSIFNCTCPFNPDS